MIILCYENLCSLNVTQRKIWTRQFFTLSVTSFARRDVVRVCLPEKPKKKKHFQSLQFRTLNCNCKLALGNILYKKINAYPNGRLGQIEERSSMKALT